MEQPRSVRLHRDSIAKRAAWLDLAEQLRAAFRSRDRLQLELLLVRMLAMSTAPRLTMPRRKRRAMAELMEKHSATEWI